MSFLQRWQEYIHLTAFMKAVPQLCNTAALLHWICVRSRGIRQSGCETEKDKIPEDSTAKWWKSPVGFSSREKNVVCQWEWQIYLMLGPNNPLMAVLEAEQWKYVNEKQRRSGVGVCVALWFFQLWSTMQFGELLKSWLFHRKDNHSLDIYWVLSTQTVGFGCTLKKIIIHTLCITLLHFLFPHFTIVWGIKCFSKANNPVLHVHILPPTTHILAADNLVALITLCLVDFLPLCLMIPNEYFFPHWWVRGGGRN